MRTALASTVLAAAITAVMSMPAAAAQPTRGQIARAVTAAERSPSLWATINICNSHRYPDQIGVRGQMPSLGFSTAMSMTVTLNSWSATTKRFVAIASPNAVDAIPLGTHSRSLEQKGVRYPFNRGQKGLWDATIVFTWKRDGKVLGQTQRTTTAGHRDADEGSPPHYSAAQCRFS